MFRFLLNTFIVYKSVTGYKQDFMHFLLQTSKDLLVQYNHHAQEMIERPSPQQLPLLPTTNHNLKMLEGGKKKKWRVCYPKRKDTRYHCPECPGKPGLCSLDHCCEWHKPTISDQNKSQPSTSGGQRKHQKV